MKKLFVITALVLVGAGVGVSVFAGTLLSGRARLDPVKPSVTSDLVRLVRGKAEFVELNGELTVKAIASGLDPKQEYVSLLYDRGSVATGPNACKGAPVFVGSWNVNGKGGGSLSTTVATGFSLTDFGTMSIRVLDGSQPPTLQACGRIVIRRKLSTRK